MKLTVFSNLILSSIICFALFKEIMKLIMYSKPAFAKLKSISKK